MATTSWGPMALSRAAAFATLAIVIGGCGGGGDAPGSDGAPARVDAGSDIVTTLAENTVAVTVDQGPPGAENVNGLFTTVTLCVPGTAQCQTIDHVLVDTGSIGLRVLASELTLSLPAVKTGSGQQLVECLPFVLGTAWGPVATADVKVGGELAANLPIQLIGDPTYPLPDACTGSPVTDLSSLLARGILGVGTNLQDCGTACAQPATSPANPGLYYGCASPQSCAVVAVPVANQIPHPVAAFPADNNGTIISLPAVPTSGAASVQGTLTFGIGTRDNNGLGSAAVLPLDVHGFATTTFPAGGKTYTSYIDSGSNGLYFLDRTTAGLPACTGMLDGFYCPQAPVSLSAVISASGGGQTTIAFTVTNAATLNGAYHAFDDLAGELPGFGMDPRAAGFDWGMPFFFGRSVYTAIETRGTPAGPYVAF